MLSHTVSRIEEPEVMAKEHRRAGYGGHWREYYIVFPTEGSKDLECFTCHDKSLYHNARAFWDDDKCDLLCPDCYELKKVGECDVSAYIEVLTFH